MSKNNEVTTFVGSNTSAKNGYTGKGQTQQFAGEEAQATLLTSIDKGGMRGAGLIAVAIAEASLKKQAVDLAYDYYDINKKDYDFFRETHQGPISQTVDEAMSEVTNPTYIPDPVASIPAGISKLAVGEKQWFEVRRRAHRYATGLMQRIDYEFAMMRTHGVVAGWNVGTRYEIQYAQEHNNRRFDRKIAVSNIGIGVGNIVRAGLASSVSGLASARDNLGDMISTIGNGLAANTGYRAGRQDTNERFKSVTRSSGVNVKDMEKGDA